MRKKIKTATKDFSLASLPHSRREEFGDILRHRYKTLLMFGLTFLVFMLPALLVAFFGDYAENAYIIKNQSAGLSQNDLAAGLARIQEINSLFMILALAVGYLGFAGLVRILHELVWGEGIFFFHDWLKGFKENWKTFLWVGVLVGGFRFLDGFVYDFSELPIIVRILPFVIDADIVWPLGILFLSLSSIYKMKTKTLLYDSFVFFVKSFPLALLFSLGLLSPLLMGYLSNFLLKYGMAIVIIAIVAPVYFLGFELYLARLYDVNLNSCFPGQRYRGLYHEEE